MKNKRLIANIIEVLAGAALAVCGYAGILDSFWSGMGTALVIIGGILLLQQIRYRIDKAYQENVDLETNDERNKYLRVKAWSWAGYIFVMITALGAIALKIVGLEQYVPIASGSACLMMVLYWVSYLVLQRKY